MVTVIKIGGNIIDNDSQLQSFLKAFAAVAGKKILIHGGGKIATRIGDQLGIESKYVEEGLLMLPLSMWLRWSMVD